MKAIHKPKTKLIQLISLALITACGFFNLSSVANAESFQSTEDVSFTFTPTLSVSVSSADLLISSLTPGTSSDSNIITVTASGNALGGFQVNSTVGSSTYNYTDIKNSANANYAFTSLGDSSASSLSNLGSNKWGYSYSTNSGSTWRSGNVDSTSPNPYGGYTDTSTSITHINTSAPGSSSFQFKIGANAANTQAAGTYNNVIKFAIVANPNPEPPAIPGLCTDEATCMQTITLADCPTTPTAMTDARDGKTYTVAKLADNNCWMLDNLALDPVTVSLADLKGNTNASDTTLEYFKGTSTGTTSDKYPTAAVSYGDSSNYYSIPKVSVSGTCYNAYCVNGGSAGSPWSSTDSTSKTINGVTSIAQGKIGAYYNYCAASAGSYCYGDGTANTGSPSSDPDTNTIRDVTEDLCPAGWHMPTTDTNGGEYRALYTAYSSNYETFQTALNTPLSGLFYSGTGRGHGDSGTFWSSTWNNTGRMRSLGVSPSSVGPSGSYYRYYGYSLRCSLGS